MFSNIGWGEVFFILIVGLIVIGPERLPGVIEDVRAGIYAARKAINNAKKELNGEMEEFEEFRGSFDTVTQYAAMGPKRAVAKVLFDGDEDYLDGFDPREAGRQPGTPNVHKPQKAEKVEKPRQPKEDGGGFSWADIT